MPQAEGDAQRLQQALSHLLQNAIERSPRGAAVRVQVAARKTGFVALVEDQGAAKFSGFDLGLSLAKAIVERLGGALRIGTRDEGPGAAFRVELPLAAGELEAGQAMRIEELFDLEIIDEIVWLHARRGDDAARELLELFAADAHRSLMRIRVSAWLGEADSLKREAHRLKGTSGSIGATRLQMECIALERCAGEGDLGELVGLEERIEHAFSVLKETRDGIRSSALFQKARRCSNMEPAT